MSSNKKEQNVVINLAAFLQRSCIQAKGMTDVSLMTTSPSQKQSKLGWFSLPRTTARDEVIVLLFILAPQKQELGRDCCRRSVKIHTATAVVLCWAGRAALCCDAWSATWRQAAAWTTASGKAIVHPHSAGVAHPASWVQATIRLLSRERDYLWEPELGVPLIISVCQSSLQVRNSSWRCRLWRAVLHILCEIIDDYFDNAEVLVTGPHCFLHDQNSTHC